MLAQEEIKNTQTQPTEQNNKIRVKLYFDSRNTEVVNFVNQIVKDSNQRFQEKVEIFLLDVSKDKVAAEEVNIMLEEIFKDNVPKELKIDVICLFEDGRFILGSDNIEIGFQPTVLSKLYPDLVKAIAESSRNTPNNDGLMKSKNYQGSASLGDKPSASPNQRKANQVNDEENDYLNKFQLVLNILISIVSLIFGFFLGFLIFYSSKKNKVQLPKLPE